jgi:methanogenic corrinoid protein MtbC1
LPVDVIRAWERRYGLPRPARTTGGHRLYSPRDVALLRRAAALRGQGLGAAAACAQALAEAAPAALPPPDEVAHVPITTDLSARLCEAALALDAGSVSTVLNVASALVDVETLWTQVIAPALSRVGGDWEDRAVTPAPEHLLSSLVRGRLAALLEALPRFPGAPSVIIGAAPDEQHDVAALMLAVLLARAGWTVTFLGAATPREAWDKAIRTVRPRVVVVTATLARHAAAARAILHWLRERLGTQVPVLAYGGPGFTAAPLPAEDERLFTRLTDDVPAAARQLATLA